LITVTGLELRVGPRLLLEEASFHIGPGDRVGLVGRNGAGKTTLARALAGEGLPDGGTVTRSGEVGYLPQGPGEGDLDVLAHERVLSGRGLDRVLEGLREAQETMAAGDRRLAGEAMDRYARLEAAFQARGGYFAEAEASSIASGLGLPDRVLGQPLKVLSGGQRRRVELARILFSGAETLLLDEPTNHLDSTSIAWLRDFLRGHRGGLLVISHHADLLEATVNRVIYLDAARAAIDVYNMGWRAYLQQRELDDRRRHRERAGAEKKAAALRAQADRMRYKATRAAAAQGMDRRAERLLREAGEVRRSERVARLRLPDPAPCGREPLRALGLSKAFGSVEVLHGIDLEVERASRTVVLGLNGAGKTTLLRILAGLERPDGGTVEPGHGLKLGYYAQEHETLQGARTVLENMRAAAPGLGDGDLRRTLGSFLFSGEAVNQPVRTLSGGEKTRLALALLVVSGANVLLLDEPTNNLDPASRREILGALETYRGAILLVTHDEGAVEALRPERVLLLPEGLSDTWSPDLADLVSLA
jgi:ATPase subunit of ABC transporter with duplicated ATPase domains